MTMTEADVEVIEYIFDRMKLGSDGVLSDWERSFMQDQKTRYDQYGSETRFSEKQWAIIDKIEAALVEGKRAPRRR